MQESWSSVAENGVTGTCLKTNIPQNILKT